MNEKAQSLLQGAVRIDWRARCITKQVGGKKARRRRRRQNGRDGKGQGAFQARTGIKIHGMCRGLSAEHGYIVRDTVTDIVTDVVRSAHTWAF